MLLQTENSTSSIKNSGNAYTNRWAEIDGIWYEFNDQGYAQAKKGEFYTTDGSTWFYRDAAGKM